MKDFIFWAIALIAVLTVVVAFYVTVGRKMLAGTAFLNWIEPLERRGWWKSETMLWSRFRVAAGSLLAILLTVDWNSVAPLIPESRRATLLALPAIFTALDGLIGEYLRRDTTKPLEIVAMRTDAPAEVKAAAAQAEAVTAEAKAAVVQSEPV